jgi:dTDP-4-dehydrorhamnose 3,5-epimerase
MSLELVPTRLAGVALVKPHVARDQRGFFLEAWHQDKFAAAGLGATFVQDNHSRSTQWTLRGLHFQIEQPQGKLIRVGRGSAFTVAVDVRRSSPTFGQWVGVELSDSNHDMLWIAPGFAHGFLALTPDVDYLYKCTDFYAPQHDRALRWNDPRVGVTWPLPPGRQPLVSARDAVAPGLDEVECYP